MVKKVNQVRSLWRKWIKFMIREKVNRVHSWTFFNSYAQPYAHVDKLCTYSQEVINMLIHLLTLNPLFKLDSKAGTLELTCAPRNLIRAIAHAMHQSRLGNNLATLKYDPASSIHHHRQCEVKFQWGGTKPFTSASSWPKEHEWLE